MFLQIKSQELSNCVYKLLASVVLQEQCVWNYYENISQHFTKRYQNCKTFSFLNDLRAQNWSALQLSVHKPENTLHKREVESSTEFLKILI